MQLTIKKRVYTITPDDRFLDNGRSITMLTQGNSPRLTKQAETQLESVKRVNVKSGYTRNVTTFGVDI